MMYSGIVSDIKNELNDWLNTRGGLVSDLALSLINRAIEQLWLRREWDMLRKTYTMTLDTNNSCAVPSDFGRLLFVGRDADSDGVLDWYYSNGDRDYYKRYELSTALSATNNVTIAIKFPFAPASNPILGYVVKLNRVVNDTDGLFFPASLVLLTAQKIHATEKSMSGLEINGINNAWKELIIDYEESNYHIDKSMSKWQQDSNFNRLSIENYSLDGNISDYIPDRSNSEDR
jgi:hypothetical protein